MAIDLTRLREQRKLSKHDLAHQTGLSYQHIDNLEQGRKPITLAVLRKLDAVLHLPAHVIVAFVRGGPCLVRAVRARLVWLVLGSLGLG